MPYINLHKRKYPDAIFHNPCWMLATLVELDRLSSTAFGLIRTRAIGAEAELRRIAAYIPQIAKASRSIGE